MNEKLEKSKKPRKKRTALKVVGAIFAVLLFAGGAYAFSVYQSAKNALDTAYTPIETDRDVELSKHNPFSVLLLGIDLDEGRSTGRSDTIMVVTVNPNEGSTKILSVARDSLVDIVGWGTRDKINHAYAFGGAQMSVDTVQNFLDIPIDYYAEIDMEGFMTLVDVVGGVTVDNDLDFSQDGHHFPVGRIRLDNSDEVLAYVRMRYEDPNGDFGRQARQRNVLTALVHEMASYAVTRYQDIFDTVGDNMKTNLTMNDLISISMNYRSALNNIEELELRGAGQRIDGVYYQIISDDELQATRNILKNHLEIE